ncbi:type II secretion system F family protein [Catenulispora sp. NL8]|uniref:Type II secretion system F family protein n=1 Tax=Catenulispora pinistramenti TaxID=2705254 RepID=A0ABS5KHA2_9ACTN|nr:type II secretion system F family protein [Catenulispora pinistramenti]MBS2545488.1 type II secretion system F family protein [Catenulispora pinistramenti]
MLLLVIAAAAGGVGLWLLLVGLVPPRLSLAEQMARVPTSAVPSRVGADAPEASFTSRLGGRVAAVLSRSGLPGAGTRANLVLLDREVLPFLTQKAGCAALGVMLPMASFTALSIVGVELPMTVLLLAAGVLAGVLFFVPDLALGSEVEEFRAAGRMAVRTFLDQAATTLAGGAGIEQALIAAADGHGPVFRAIHDAITDARAAREPAWPHLDELGKRLGIRELSELAAACTLAGAEGAKVKSSITAKARSMREKEFAAQTEAVEAASERLAMPGGLLGMSFVCFLTYAALAAASKQI